MHEAQGGAALHRASLRCVHAKLFRHKTTQKFTNVYKSTSMKDGGMVGDVEDGDTEEREREEGE